ncbi:MAG: NUDIX hydrolase [Lachnospiraceae bacterium]|nr:NUDIX hydrolase [Lachnospiraceae bacterium]
MELWDAYDSDGKRIEGMTLVRGSTDGIPRGVFHLVCDILVRHVDGTYLLMQRDSRTRHGGMWEASAGGSALQGESPLACAVRELREETGIEAGDLTEVGRVVDEKTHGLYVEFLFVTDRDKDDIRLQEGETVGYRWVSREEFLRMPKKELLTRRMQRFLPELQPDT